MKTKSDILAAIEQVKQKAGHAVVKASMAADKALEPLKAELFAAYDADKTLQAFLSKVENCDTKDDYFFDECGTLMSFYELPFELENYPLFEDYIVENETIGQFNKKEKRMEVCHGDPITVNWNAGTREYLVYNCDTREPIIESRRLENGKEVDETYVRAKIELYQRERGEFGDVVEVDYYGGYMAHFDQTWPEKGQNIGAITDEELKKIIDSYEVQDEEQGE